MEIYYLGHGDVLSAILIYQFDIKYLLSFNKLYMKMFVNY